MIFGNGIDIVEVSRFKKWLIQPELINRYFNKNEQVEKKQERSERQISSEAQHYAVRFAAKEAFSKALGTGIDGFDLVDVYVKNNENGKPYIVLEKSAKALFEKLCPGAKIFLSLSHEKEYACANVIIEN